MSLEAVRSYFKRWNIEERIQEFPVSSATVQEAARAIGCDEKEIAKTLAFKVSEQAILIVVAGDAKIDNAKYKVQFHIKATMLKSEEVEQITGHPTGGVCPFGISDTISVYLDTSLKRFQAVHPACGSTNSSIKLTIEELERYSNYKEWVNVCKGW